MKDEYSFNLYTLFLLKFAIIKQSDPFATLIAFVSFIIFFILFILFPEEQDNGRCKN
jgi:hypothetical protein